MREYLARLDARGDILHVHREVDPHHELAAVTQAVARRIGKPILFHKVPNKDHWGRMGIDATAPFARRDEFLRKRIPGADTVNLADYIEGMPR
jgi:3-polyprenyl-4-hydroxybenzoate decarboxylase